MGTLRIAGAFLRRDALSEASYRVSVLLESLSLLLTLGMFYYFGRIVDVGAPDSIRLAAPQGYFAYALTGAAMNSVLTTSVRTYADATRHGQLTGTLETVALAPIPGWHAAVFGGLWTTLRCVARVVAYVAAGAVMGVRLSPASLLPAVTTLVLTLAALTPFGILAAAYVLVFKRGEPVSYLVTAASMFLAGAYFPLGLLPPALSRFAVVFPLTHAINAFRGALLKENSFRELVPEFAFLSIFAVVAAPASVFIYEAALRWAKSRGALGQY